MKYPNNIKKNNNKNVVYGNRGMDLENLINIANQYYIDNDIALIYKKPTPIGVVNVSYKNNKGVIDKAYFKEPSTLDYNGLYKGKYIEFEAKETKSKTSFPLANVHDHQINHLKSVLKHGGIGFLIIGINNIVYLLDGNAFFSYIDNTNRKSIEYSFIKDNGYIIKSSFNGLDYLNIVNNLYFGGENEKN